MSGHGRVAVVTGGTRGIGEAVSVLLRDHGYRVAAGYGGDDEKARQALLDMADEGQADLARVLARVTP